MAYFPIYVKLNAPANSSRPRRCTSIGIGATVTERKGKHHACTPPLATCVLCAAGGVLFADIGVRAQTPGFTRTVLNRSETPGDTMVTVQVLVEVEPNALIARHTHPGTETGYFLDGTGTLGMQGQPDRAMKTGDAFQVPVELPHFVQNGPGKTRILSIYVVDKNKPLASPAPV